MLLRSRRTRFMLDGELVIPIGEALSFDALQLRLHPAGAGSSKLSRETPAQLMAVRCAADRRRSRWSAGRWRAPEALESFLRRSAGPRLHLSPDDPRPRGALRLAGAKRRRARRRHRQARGPRRIAPASGR